ncbi:NAD-dependent epimerase/dehydratase family protein [Nocardia sp. NPDC051570]|uniref:NAD-dependent epimerase/dehydratase family protein n=1 Tax=Nocardia sp. NPDC051570 TaxID=3364324 RepID=UPI003790C076
MYDNKVLITGGAGFIGGHLARAMVALGYEVDVVDDLRVPPMVSPDGSAKLLEKPVLDLDEDDLANVGIVYHLASHKSVPRSFNQPLDYLDNIDSCRHLLALCTGVGTPKVVVASTCEVYGEASVLPTPEGAPLAPRSPYAATKVGVEMIARAHQRAEGAPEVGIARFFNVYGPGERPDELVPRLCANLLVRNELPVEGDGEQRRDFSYVTDTVRKLTELATGPLAAIVNIGSGRSFSVNDVVRVLQERSPDARVVRKPARINEIREFRADTKLQICQIGDLPGQTSLAEGIRRTFDWWADRDPEEILRRLFREESN